MKLFLGAIALLFLTNPLVQAADPDASRSLDELIASRGLVLQKHQVTTEDGYILEVHRVVPEDYDPLTYSRKRKPVIAFHGVLCQSPVFFMNSPCLKWSDPDCEDNFGLRQAFNGSYDLWVPNARGNGYSNGHKWLNSKRDFDYWKFSWEQIGRYDVPAIINLVLKATGHKSVGYIGYSQGGASALAMLTLRPEYAQYIKPYIGWAPSVYLGEAPTVANLPAQVLAPALAKTPWEFIITESWFNSIASTFCQPIIGPLPGALCSAALQAAMGESTSLNKTRLPVYMHFFPSPGSNWQVAHFGQQLACGRFARYDYGSVQNLLTYGTIQPPDFPLGQIPKTLTTIIMYGQTDALVTPENSETLANYLRTLQMVNVVNVTIANRDNVWSHFDFVAGTGAGKLVYDKTIDYLDQYTVWDGPV